ncbi:unnamed protein product [Effrenium voratum]|uniref:Protein kinase domain-containing protein n=1 Tax=Effrenium voratum TaxID=2562239 RepID=A0AA36HQU0_9DINO|nr:unnamed protein product [Effrenium voratum]CAJ1453068.1 unnamed protein product [Effrenium voratum]
MPSSKAYNLVYSSMPESQDADIQEGYFQEGEVVVYHSRTHSGYLRTRITKIHAVAGVVQAIDLTCKKSADMAKIAKIHEAPSVERQENVLAELPSPLFVENAERRRADTYLEGLIAYEAGAVGKAYSEPQSPAMFSVGDKVFYNSKTHSQQILAVVEGVTADGLYDLDVKKSAHPLNLLPYVESPSPAPALATAPAFPTQAPPRPEERTATRVQLPIQHVRVMDSAPVRVMDGTPTNAGATPLSCTPSSAAEFVASRHTGEGRIVSCKVSAAVPIGPTVPSPIRSGAPPVSFFPQSMTPKANTPKATSAAAAEIVSRLCGELRCGRFDPQLPEVRQQLLAQLQLRPNSRIQEMGGFAGGLNQGIWIVTSGNQKLVLKQVRCQRIASNILTEAENFVRIVKDHPEISRDPLIAFPVKLLSCIGPEGKFSDVICMKKSPGERLCEFVAAKFYAKQMVLLQRALQQVGQALARFHQRYEEQHGDFQPSNIYYQEKTGVVTFIDVGGMGVPTMGNDVDHFHQCMRAMTVSYNANLYVDLLRAFDKGYQSPASPKFQGSMR